MVVADPPIEKPDAASARAQALIGRTLSDRYRIVALVAMGGMGAVYKAEHLLMHKHVAVKVLHPDVEGFPELVARFEREAVAGAHIQHPNVAIASDFGKFDGGSAFLVLEYIEGITLRDLMDLGPVPPRRAASIVRQVAAALSAVHQKGIVHRDVKPRNIMIGRRGGSTPTLPPVESDAEDVVKLIDFGLAKVPVEGLSAIAKDDNLLRELTEAGVVMGTFGYLAPEAALGTRSIMAPADLYALGVVFYEMLCGKRLFEGDDAARVFMQHRKSSVPSLRERNPDLDVPPVLEGIVRTMLEKDPQNRFPSAAALVSALDDALATMAGKVAPSERMASLLPPREVEPVPAPSFGILRYVLGGLLVAAVTAGAMFTAERRNWFGMHVPLNTPSALPTASVSVESSVRAPPPRAPKASERLRAASDGDPAAALTTLIALADAEPQAFADRAVQAEAATIIENAMSKGLPADAAFDRLAGPLGSDGLDILYDLFARGRSAGPKARTALGKPEVIARATPAMHVAYDLRRATCQQRPSLFARAAKEGDDRALEILRTMQPPACAKKDPCCLEKNRQLELTIVDVQSRLRH